MVFPVRQVLYPVVENAAEIIYIPSAAAPEQASIRDMVEKAVVTSIDEQTTEPAAQHSTQEQRISTYTEEE